MYKIQKRAAGKTVGVGIAALLVIATAIGANRSSPSEHELKWAQPGAFDFYVRAYMSRWMGVSDVEASGSPEPIELLIPAVGATNATDVFDLIWPMLPEPWTRYRVVLLGSEVPHQHVLEFSGELIGSLRIVKFTARLVMMDEGRSAAIAASHGFESSTVGVLLVTPAIASDDAELDGFVTSVIFQRTTATSSPTDLVLAGITELRYATCRIEEATISMFGTICDEPLASTFNDQCNLRCLNRGGATWNEGVLNGTRPTTEFANTITAQIQQCQSSCPAPGVFGVLSFGEVANWPYEHWEF